MDLTGSMRVGHGDNSSDNSKSLISEKTFTRGSVFR